MKRINIINGINTDVGKTYLTAKKVKQEILKGNKICVLKPIISGFETLDGSDSGIYMDLLDLDFIEEVSCYVLKEPASPNIAAKMEGVELSYSKILDFCRERINKALEEGAYVFVEMAGGVMSPITDTKTMLDLTLDITKNYGDDVCNILVTSNYLGAISHTLSACKLLSFDKIIFNTKQPSKYDEEIRKTIEGFTCKFVDIDF